MIYAIHYGMMIERHVINKDGSLEATVMGSKNAGWDIIREGVVVEKLLPGRTIKEAEKVALQYGGSRIMKTPSLKGRRREKWKIKQ